MSWSRYRNASTDEIHAKVPRGSLHSSSKTKTLLDQFPHSRDDETDKIFILISVALIGTENHFWSSLTFKTQKFTHFSIFQQFPKPTMQTEWITPGEANKRGRRMLRLLHPINLEYLREIISLKTHYVFSELDFFCQYYFCFFPHRFSFYY